MIPNSNCWQKRKVKLIQRIEWGEGEGLMEREGKKS
jgi:hypothetical protein